MSDYQLNINDFLEESRRLPVIDVRSPAEFERGHIPGARNMPLFTNEERSIVGTLYLQKGSKEAMLKGLELIGPKLRQFAVETLDFVSDNEVLLHCWRGGMRSNSMAWLFNTVGIKSHTLQGGYKSYRRFVQSSFSDPLNLIVIGGMTGSGKTAVLETLESIGKQVIHLERLACHRGSVFGGIGMPVQPTTEHFENELFHQLRQLNPKEPVFVEDESLAIGKVFIPRPFFEQMSSAVFIDLYVPLNRRIKNLVEAYAIGDRNDLIAGVKRIEKRLGLRNAAFITDHIRNGQMDQAVEMILKYYDKIYAQSMAMHKSNKKMEIMITDEDPDKIAERIIELK